MILKGTGLKIDIGMEVGVYIVYYAMLFLGGGVTFKTNQVLPNQNLTICLFQTQSRFGLVLSRVGGGGWSKLRLT